MRPPLAAVCVALAVAATGCSPVAASGPVQAMPAGAAPASVEPTPAAEPAPAPPAAPAYAERTVIGRSVEGREVVAWRFGTGERRTLVVGGIHGNEFGADVADALVARLAADPSLVPPGVEIHVIPDLDPDGRAAGKRGNANHVDLNLNMPSANWRRDLDPHTRAYQSGLNGGSHAASEPETQAFIGYLQRGFGLVVSLHSSGGIVDWDGDGEAIARQMAKRAGLKAEHLAVQPYATGTMGQYVPEAWGIPVITIELESRTLTSGLADALLWAAGARD